MSSCVIAFQNISPHQKTHLFPLRKLGLTQKPSCFALSRVPQTRHSWRRPHTLRRAEEMVRPSLGGCLVLEPQELDSTLCLEHLGHYLISAFRIG